MTKIKCIGLERSNLTNLAKAIEDFQNTHNLVSLGSIPFTLEKGVGVIMFFPEMEKGQVGDEVLSPSHESPKAPNSKEKFKTPESWKSKEPTLKQRNTLKKMGYSWEEINTFSMYKASKLIGREE